MKIRPNAPAILSVLAAIFLITSAVPAFTGSRYKALLSGPAGRGRLEALAQLEETRTIAPYVIEPLLVDPNTLIRLRCAEVLGRIGSTEGVPYIEKLTGDRNAEIVESALFSLGLIGRCLNRRGYPSERQRIINPCCQCRYISVREHFYGYKP